jgi:hypothetical protein
MRNRKCAKLFDNIDTHIGLLATDALAFTSAPASVGSATLSTSNQDNFVVPVSTSDEEEEEDVVVEEDDGTILLQFVAAQTDLENVLTVIHAQGVSSRLLNKLDKDGKNLFCMDLAMVWDDGFDATVLEADATGTREDFAAAKAHNKQLFRTRTKKALRATMQRTADADDNTSLVTKALDGVLTYTNFMSEKA